MPKVAFANSYLTIWRGNDCLRFLDSLSSNNVIELQNGCLTQTAILSKHAKIIDFVTVLNLGEFIAVIGFQPNFASMIEYVTPKILQSSVEIMDISDLNDVIIYYDENIKMEIGSCESNEGITLAKISESYGLCIAAKKLNVSFDTIADDFDEWRIRNKIPWYGSEIKTSSTPYGCGLNEFVHDDKGCFAGQEILTRMRTRERGIKKLMIMDNSDITTQKTTTSGNTSSLIII